VRRSYAGLRRHGHHVAGTAVSRHASVGLGASVRQSLVGAVATQALDVGDVTNRGGRHRAEKAREKSRDPDDARREDQCEESRTDVGDVGTAALLG